MAYYSLTDDITYTALPPKKEAELFHTLNSSEKGSEAGTAARNTIMANYLKLAAKLALRFANRSLPDEDAIAAGNQGLLVALEARKFDPSRGNQFASYVRNYIRGEVCTMMRAVTSQTFDPEKDSSSLSESQPLAFHQPDWTPADAALTGAQEKGDDRDAGKTGNGALKFSRGSREIAIDPEAPEKLQSEDRCRIVNAVLSDLSKVDQFVLRAALMEGLSMDQVAERIAPMKGEGFPGGKISRQAMHKHYYLPAFRRLSQRLAPMKEALV